ncbi:MAG TPA: glycosyltransferase [Nitrospiraceae bacterium]|nr:glycosyltransferase [Nitrospiraceae bacterium]
MPSDLSAYRHIAPPGRVDLLYQLCKQVKGKRMLHISSSRIGGGSAEILHNLTPMLRDLGLRVEWSVMEGSEAFYHAVRVFHEGLQGEDVTVTDSLLNAYLDCIRHNAATLDLSADGVVAHDPHPLALIDQAPTDSRWIWRCYLDLSRPQRKVWNFLRPYVAKYDAAVFSLPQFAQPLSVPQFLIYPSIDPLSDKNRDMTPEEMDQILSKLNIPRDKPILLQVSRFNRFKDPLGLIDAYRLIKSHHDCRLVLAGGIPPDDHEDLALFDEVRDAASKDEDIHILLLDPGSHLEINALQRSATLVFQKSKREGFGLTVTEAMWKGKPVIGGATGGITLQVVYGQTGYTANSVEGTAFYARYLLNNPAIAEEMGRRARERVRQNFLITRHVEDYLSLMILMSRA